MVQRRPDRTLGPGHDEFWQWCGHSELRLQRCLRCHYLCWPVVSACEQCDNGEFRWERMSGRGKLVSWCTFHRDYYQGVLRLPWETILVELDEGPLLISNPWGFVCRHVEIGMRVTVEFIECADSAGHFRLPVFRQAARWSQWSDTYKYFYF